MKLSIIVPVYNEAKTVQDILEKLFSLNLGDWEKEIIVVDDGSTDNFRKLIKGSGDNKFRVFHHLKNKGKGAAIRTGLSHATGDYVIVQDADLEYNPQDIRSLLITSENNPGYVIYGSRFRGRHEDTIFGHKAGNLFLTTLTNFLYGANISDMETCYKLIPMKYIHQIRLESNRFNFEPEITAKLLKLKIGILEVPVNYKKRGFSEGKKIKWWRDGFSAVATLLGCRLFT